MAFLKGARVLVRTLACKVENPNGLPGTILEALAGEKYLVRLDDGREVYVSQYGKGEDGYGAGPVGKRNLEPVQRIQYDTHQSDERGRCRFTLFWWADYHPGDPRGEHRHAERAQCFFADPREYGFPRPEEAA